MESLQAWGFALRATTPQVAFGYVPTSRSSFSLIDKIHYSMLDVRCSMFLSFFPDQTGRSRPAAAPTPDTRHLNTETFTFPTPSL